MSLASTAINAANRVLNRFGWGLAPYPTPPTLHNLWQYALYSELIRETKDVPGAVIECGVAFGRGVLTLLHAERSFGSGRRVYGFDTFSGYPLVSATDNARKQTFDDGGRKTSTIAAGALRWSRADVMRFIQNSGLEKDTIANLTLVEGDVAHTLPKLDQPVAIAILEMDLYRSTKDALMALKPKMSKGGLIAPLNYNSKFKASRDAVDEVFSGLEYEVSKTDPRMIWFRF